MMKTIVVATDFSADADRALSAAIDMAARDVSHLEIVHVARPGTYVLPPPLDIVTLPVSDREMTYVNEALDARAERARLAHVSAATQLRTGTPHAEVVQVAKETRAALIVVGSHGAGMLATALIGSVRRESSAMRPAPSW